MNNTQSFDLYGFYRNILQSDNEELILSFVKYSRIVKVKKGEILFRPGNSGPSTVFLLDGVIKTFILSSDGTENTFAIYFKPGTGVAMTEEMINVPEIWCKTLTPCTLIEMIGQGPYELTKEFPELWEKLMYSWRPFYFGMMDKLRAGYTLTAKERYLWFVNKYGPLVDKISLNEISLFLGIAPQSLSRIKNELAAEQNGAARKK